MKLTEKRDKNGQNRKRGVPVNNRCSSTLFFRSECNVLTVNNISIRGLLDFRSSNTSWN